ncbi:MvaI/BcnI family restriction endonuclease [Candidatus Parabeggiatoa sp. HSG14]|uniref:MvaI/BcnI family restriction endonuclease n=1 Tax=Candidatus Parabeggiatoa sp. HSG14 TaxID=3055593 RepID=UPI0025A7EBF1|nr:MvaI/BcnI family restriction endonuclease [Thiotrichales bacterium HSG14]
MKTYTKDSLIKTLIEIRQMGWIPTGRKNNDGGVGNTLEDFRQTINANGYSNRGFSVKVDRNERKILVDFSSEKIDKKIHTDWAKAIIDKKLEPQPYWGFDDLFHKAGTKLHNCFFVWAESKKIDGKLHFHYQDIFMLKKLDINKFIQAIENGHVYIDFDARTGHNHGTKFRLRREALINLYAEVKQY